MGVGEALRRLKAPEKTLELLKGWCLAKEVGLPDDQCSVLPLLKSPHGVLSLLLVHVSAELPAPHAMRRQLEYCVLHQRGDSQSDQTGCATRQGSNPFVTHTLHFH